MDQALAKQAQEREQEPEPTMADFIEPFLEEKARPAPGHKPYGADTVGQTRATFRLWTELIGELPVAKVGRKEAGEFRALLLRMPTNHGKAVGRGAVRPPPVPALQAIAAADALDKAAADAARKEGRPAPAPRPRLSMKTAKRHFSSMQQLWKHMRQFGAVDANPLSGLPFPGTKARRFSRDDWSEADLLRLLGSEHMCRAALARERDWWMVVIAMYSGMRLEEICRLRPEADLRVEEGVPFLLIQEQEDSPWSPKSEVGERAVPVHPVLLSLGLLELAAARAGHARLVPGTRSTGRAGKLGAEFSRQFSKVKASLRVGGGTVFHSFRASVSTVLRNQDATLRDVWIDAVLGHEGSGGRSLGITVYFKRVGVANLRRTVEAIRYPATVEAAVQELAALGQPGEAGGKP